MLNHNELRIGNWIMDQAPYDDTFAVRWSHIASIIENEARYRPIPLSPSWLDKLGFIEKNNKNHYGWYADLTIKNRFLCWAYGSEVSIENGDGDELYSMPCKSVHDLQNAYFLLTGQELEIKQ